MASRASSSQHASRYKRRGHHVEKLFAQEIGRDEEYKNAPQGKKDVVDLAGDAHSVKGGDVHWQMFLYGRDRLINDDGFQALNGVGALLVHCLDVFPSTLERYKNSEDECKEKLKTPMADLKDRFQRKTLLRAFLNKAFFNSGEVNYLSVLYENQFHVFKNDDVISALVKKLTVENNSTGLKVVMKYEGNNLGELEVRNDQSSYKRILFNINIKRIMTLLFDSIPICQESALSENILVYGNARKHFGKEIGDIKQLPKSNLEEKLLKIVETENV